MPKSEQVYMGEINTSVDPQSEAKPVLISAEPYKSNYMLPEEINEQTTIVDVARSIALSPNLWGIYSIADAFNGLVEWEVRKRLAAKS